MSVCIPERGEISVDETHIVMRAEELAKLPEYSTSLPTGTTPGKRWKCNTNRGFSPPVWWMGEYGVTLDEQVEIKWREILVIE